MAINYTPIAHYSKDGTTIWLPLPREFWKPITGSCDCKYCKQSGESFWDTLCLSTKPTKAYMDLPHYVHFPELHQERDQHILSLQAVG